MPRMTGSQYFADTMLANGVSHVFFVPVVLTPALVAMEKSGIVPVMTHGEKSAAYMADGYARASGKPGVCLAQTIGAANLAAGLRDAYLARSPVIAVTGGKSPEGKYRHVYQEIDDFAVFQPLTKYNVQVDSPDRLPDLLRQAFREATTGCPQPVHLECAGNMGQAIEGEADIEPVFEAKYSRVPAFRPLADPADVRAVADVLASAERPVIVAGGGVRTSGAHEEVVALARKLSIPVATSLNGKGTIAENDELSLGLVGLYGRKSTNRIVCQADLVFYIGSLTGTQVTNGWQVPPPNSRVIQLDIEAREFGRNYSNAASMCGDAKLSLRQLIEAVKPRDPNQAWLGCVREILAEWKAEVEPLVTSDAVPMRPERICRELTAALPQDAILVSETGHSGIWTGIYVELHHPTQSFMRAAGSLGWGFPAAMGAKCAAPDRPVICFSGDGGFYYHLAEMETAVRYGINVVVVVNNNRSLNMEKELYAGAYGVQEQTRGLEMWQFQPTNFAQLAESMGCLGIRVERPSEIQPAIQQALAANRPTIIDVVSDLNIMAPVGWM